MLDQVRGRCGIPSDFTMFDLRIGFYGSKTLEYVSCYRPFVDFLSPVTIAFNYSDNNDMFGDESDNYTHSGPFRARWGCYWARKGVESIKTLFSHKKKLWLVKKSYCCIMGLHPSRQFGQKCWLRGQYARSRPLAGHDPLRNDHFWPHRSILRHEKRYVWVVKSPMTMSWLSATY